MTSMASTSHNRMLRQAQALTWKRRELWATQTKAIAAAASHL
jgi:hypothetical protein